jgi:hypothetical protein
MKSCHATEGRGSQAGLISIIVLKKYELKQELEYTSRILTYEKGLQV